MHDKDKYWTHARTHTERVSRIVQFNGSSTYFVSFAVFARLRLCMCGVRQPSSHYWNVDVRVCVYVEELELTRCTLKWNEMSFGFVKFIHVHCAIASLINRSWEFTHRHTQTLSFHSISIRTTVRSKRMKRLFTKTRPNDLNNSVGSVVFISGKTASRTAANDYTRSYYHYCYVCECYCRRRTTSECVALFEFLIYSLKLLSCCRLSTLSDYTHTRIVTEIVVGAFPDLNIQSDRETRVDSFRSVSLMHLHAFYYVLLCLIP